ncbi:RluA family pseudouridine synthase [Ectothiorhodospiraceae bacterium WFHF3C12]|nr:RluA family pseudouridine synthase [Ectothiorhodospiraceae bacterium WFHF3C12]
MPSDASKPAGGVRHIAIDPAFAEQRIDNFLLRELKGVPRSLVYRLLRKGQVRVNGGRIKAEYRLKAGDSVRLPPVRVAGAGEPVEPPQNMVERVERAILFEDPDLIIVNKPSGLAVHGGSGVPYGLVDILRRLRPRAKGLELAHRLDRGTSGCIVVAKKRSSLRYLHGLFRDGHVEKHYLTLLGGQLPKGAVPVEAALRRVRDGSGEHRVLAGAQGKPSRTVFRTVRRFRGFTLAEAALETGRMHQIRVHAASLGHPVAGDEKYGDEGINERLRALGLKRIFLHASRLSFTGPQGQSLAVEAPLDDMLQGLLDRLEAL